MRNAFFFYMFAGSLFFFNYQQSDILRSGERIGECAKSNDRPAGVFTNLFFRTKQSGNWNDVATWESSTDGNTWAGATQVPDNTDETITILNTHTVTINSSLTADQVVIDPGGVLSITGGVFTVNDGTTTDDISCNGTVTISGGNISGSGRLTINNGGVMNWNGGTLTAPVFIGSGATSAVNDASKNLSGVLTIQNGGTMNWAGGDIGFFNGSIVNSGTINNTAGGSFSALGGTVSFTNNADGVFNKNTTLGEPTSFYVPINNAGTININDGYLDNSGGKLTNTGTINTAASTAFVAISDVDLDTGTTITGNGSFSNFGLTTFNTDVDVPATVLFDMGYGMLAGDGTLTVNGEMNWSGGTIAAKIIIESTANVQVFNFSDDKYLKSTFTNNGSLDWIEDIIRFEGGSFINNGYFVIGADNSIADAGGTNLFTNNGTFDKQSGGTTTIGVPFVNSSNGILKGFGTYDFTGTLNNNGNIDPGSSPGTLTFNSASNPFSDNSKLNIEMNGTTPGTEFDQLIRDGDLILKGTINVTEGGTVPDGDYTIINLTSGSVSGNFSIRNLAFGYAVIVNQSSVVLHKGPLPEVCDGIDNDLDGLIDEGVQSIFYQDADGDGYGNAADTVMRCSAPDGYVMDNTDCDDNNAAVHPGATEVCNGIDDNCDGQIDEGFTQMTFYKDTDGDGYGDANESIQACSAPQGYVTDNTDCDDSNTAIHPGATEVCNGIDDNCDGQIDEGVQSTFYQDADGDSYGNASVSMQACSTPQGYVADNTDCDDNNANVHPGATEVCNGIDDNCDGQIDENVQSTFYQDADGDGYGNSSVSIEACSAPQGYVTDNTDCDDNNAAVHPGATEICNGIDDNCDGQVDEACSQDKDGDGYTEDQGDCDDNNAAVHPGAVEICNGIDDNCDGQIDEGVQTTFYEDADGDGYGNPVVSIMGCSAPQGYVTDNTDCNDNNAAVHPGAVEICNGIDDNCDGQIDEGIILPTFYRDADGDGYGDPSVSINACSAPSGYVSNNLDCDDTRNNVYPGAYEDCDGLDNNCNGQIDEGCVTSDIPILQLKTYSEKEGNNGYWTLNVEIKLSKTYPRPVKLNYQTIDGTATAGSDYKAISGTITVPAGATVATIPVEINGDLIDEKNEDFFVDFSNTVNVVIRGTKQARILIIDDDKSNSGNNARANLNIQVPNLLSRNRPLIITGLNGMKNELVITDLKGSVVARLSQYNNKWTPAKLATGMYFYQLLVYPDGSKIPVRLSGKLVVVDY